jgi:hypothetical protein
MTDSEGRRTVRDVKTADQKRETCVPKKTEDGFFTLCSNWYKELGTSLMRSVSLSRPGETPIFFIRERR